MTLKPTKPRMSWPWIDAKPKLIEKIKHQIKLDGKTYNLFFGDMHGHSWVSADSWYNSPNRFYRYGKEVAKLDFCALTDHDHPRGLIKNKWPRIVNAAERNYLPQEFVTFIAFEWTSGMPEWARIPRLEKDKRREYYGHRNVYFPSSNVPDIMFSHQNPKYSTPERLWDAIKQYGGISIPHHPLGGPVSPFRWDFFDEDVEPVVEIYSTHGNSEHMGCMHEIYNPKKGHSVQHALSKGLHFGFIASSDTHRGLAGNFTKADFNITYTQKYFRSNIRPPGPGLAAVYAEELTRKSIFSAIKEKRVYAITGSRIALDVRANGHFMGSVIDADAKPVKVTINVKCPLLIHKIEVVKNNRVVKSYDKLNKEADLEFIDGEREREEDYIYIRVIQEDAQMAWSSPIWISSK
ncbi:CehA/McbA family metallohydrolase [Candidatus Woesearchaeota archaeon]|nr:CehA/McbA family metallohydrolase [Candidatus Woesearchaeota archaeon]